MKNFVPLQKVHFKYNNISMAIATKQIKKQVDWQFPNEKETITIDDFREMVKNSEKSPHISFEEFGKVTDEWLSR